MNIVENTKENVEYRLKNRSKKAIKRSRNLLILFLFVVIIVSHFSFVSFKPTGVNKQYLPKKTFLIWRGQYLPDKYGHSFNELAFIESEESICIKQIVSDHFCGDSIYHVLDAYNRILIDFPYSEFLHKVSMIGLE